VCAGFDSSGAMTARVFEIASGAAIYAVVIGSLEQALQVSPTAAKPASRRETGTGTSSNAGELHVERSPHGAVSVTVWVTVFCTVSVTVFTSVTVF
jgi:hypothetical protein